MAWIRHLVLYVFYQLLMIGILSVSLVVGVRSKDCPESQFWDVGLDQCEECGPYCQDAAYRKMMAECQRLCPAFMESLASPYTEPTQKLSGWTLAGIVGAVVVAGAAIAIATILLRRQKAARYRILCLKKPIQETTQNSIPVQQTQEHGSYSRLHPLVPGGACTPIFVPRGLPREAAVV